MKILAGPDVHLTNKRPENRSDEYENTLFRKLEFILQKAVQEKAKVVVFPGDFTDTPAIPYDLFCRVVDLIRQYADLFLLCVFGQHDMRHRNRGNTALRAIQTACENFHIVENGDCLDIHRVTFYGASFGEEIPARIPGDEFCVLITHRMVVKEKLWESQEGFTWANHLLRSTKFDMIITGDNHNGFLIKDGKRLLVNCGSLMRSTISQVNHFPFVVMYDTKTFQSTKIDIPIDIYEEVFNLDKVGRQEAIDKNLEAFARNLYGVEEMGLDFQGNLQRYIRENNVDPGIANIIEECSTE